MYVGGGAHELAPLHDDKFGRGVTGCTYSANGCLGQDFALEEVRSEDVEIKVQLTRVSIVVGAMLLASVGGCATTSLFGFPVEQGNIASGRQAFIDHQCHQCHTIADERLPQLAGADRPILELGGPTTLVRSYADLTTSIINPDHAISERYRDQQLLLNTEIPLETPMPTPNLNTMSVRQLIDIVAFLDSKYELMIEDYE